MDGRRDTPWAPCQGKDGRAEGRENGGDVKGVGCQTYQVVSTTSGTDSNGAVIK